MSAQITALLEQVLKSPRRQARRVVAIAGTSSQREVHACGRAGRGLAAGLA
jgi:hypothetical protein